MARYIDADKLKEECYYYDTEEDLERYVIKHGYADVIPKSEVDKLHEVIFKKEDLMQKIAEERNKYFDELETAKDNNEHLAVMLEEAKSEVDRLKYNLKAVLEEIPKTKREFASEIFAEIESLIDGKFSINHGVVLMSKEDFAELKKKYTEGKDDRE